MNSWWMIAGIATLLFAIAIFFPSNALTGNVVSEQCKGIGCVELCDAAAPVCSAGMTCCATQWGSGVCDYKANCGQIMEYSIYQSLETYQDSVREQPVYVRADWERFFLPLLVTLGILAYFIFQRHDPMQEVR